MMNLEMTALIVFVAAVVLGFGFWIWMLVDCALHESGEGNNKLVWALIILVTYVIGAGVYFVLRRRPRMHSFSATTL